MQLGEFTGTARTILAQLIERDAAGLELCLHLSQLLAQCLRLRGDGLRQSLRLGARGGQLFLLLGQPGALRNPLLLLRHCRGRLLFDGQDTPLQVGMQPVNALEGSFSPTPALFKACQFRRNLCGLLLAQLALLPQLSQLALQCIQPRLSLRVLGLKPRHLLPLLADSLALGLACVLVARSLNRPIL